MTQQADPSGVPKKKSPLVLVLAGCAAIVIIGGIVAAGLMWWGYHKAKNYVKHAVETNTGEMKKVQLWNDVPPMEGMTGSNQGEMPFAVRALARPFMDAMMRGLNNGKEAGHYDVAFLVVNGKTIRDVEAFYTPKRMADHGWESQGACTNVSDVLFCSFQKQQGDKGAGLLIIAADDKESKSTSLYFLRQEGPAEAAKTSGSPVSENVPFNPPIEPIAPIPQKISVNGTSTLTVKCSVERSAKFFLQDQLHC